MVANLKFWKNCTKIMFKKMIIQETFYKHCIKFQQEFKNLGFRRKLSEIFPQKDFQIL